MTNFIAGFEHLPEQIREQMLDYVEFLMKKYPPKHKAIKSLHLTGKADYRNLKAIILQWHYNIKPMS